MGSHVVCNSSPGNCCTGVVCSSPYDYSSSSIVCCSSYLICSCPCDHGSSCVLRISHCHCSSSLICSCPCDHGSSCVLRSSHCHCSSSVLCSRSREHSSSCVLCLRSSCVVRSRSCFIWILWCSSVRRACNQHRALIRVQCLHCLGCFGFR